MVMLRTIDQWKSAYQVSGGGAGSGAGGAECSLQAFLHTITAFSNPYTYNHTTNTLTVHFAT